jgi:hypothetical protein
MAEHGHRDSVTPFVTFSGSVTEITDSSYTDSTDFAGQESVEDGEQQQWRSVCISASERLPISCSGVDGLWTFKECFSFASA